MAVKASVKKNVKKPATSKVERPVSVDVLEKNALGEIKVHENVVGDVVRKTLAAMSEEIHVEGSLIDSIAGLVGSGKGAIAIEMNEDSVSVAVKISIIYGKNVKTVAAKVQETIREAIVNVTSMTVAQVDVYVQRLFQPEELEAEDED